MEKNYIIRDGVKHPRYFTVRLTVMGWGGSALTRNKCEYFDPFLQCLILWHISFHRERSQNAFFMPFSSLSKWGPVTDTQIHLTSWIRHRTFRQGLSYSPMFDRLFQKWACLKNWAHWAMRAGHCILVNINKETNNLWYSLWNPASSSVLICCAATLRLITNLAAKSVSLVCLLLHRHHHYHLYHHNLNNFLYQFVLLIPYVFAPAVYNWF